MGEGTRRRAGTLVGASLGAVSLAHLYWATGATWPAANRHSLAGAALGAPGIPFGTGVALPLAALLAATALIVVARSRSWGPRGVRGAMQAWTIAAFMVLLARGLVGLVWASGLGVDTSRPFFWLNLLLYSPACLALAVATAAVEGPGHRWLRGTALGLTVVLVASAVFGAYGLRPTVVAGYRPPPSLHSLASRWIDTPLARFHYVREGAGPPLVLLAPGGSWLFAWEDQVRRLAASHTVYAVDLPGQGFTELRSERFAWDLDAMTGAIDSFIGALGLERVSLAGNSWSGGWALAYAQRHPERVNRLVLLAPSGLAEPDIWSWEILKLPLLGELMTNVGYTRSSVAATVRDLFVHQDLVTEDVVEAFWAPSTRATNRRALHLLERRLDWRVTEEAMGASATPTLVVWGDGDRVLAPRQAARFGELLPHAEVRMLEGCGHALTLDCPERVGTVMETFLGTR